MNSIQILKPYWFAGTWVFDDAACGLLREPFIAGADNVISEMVKRIPNARLGFKLIFSSIPFPGHQVTLVKQSGQIDTGTTYFCMEYKTQCWLCPALGAYFPFSPDVIYGKADQLIIDTTLPDEIERIMK